ncbi:MAG TPA: restriction endonuclease subunit S [Arachnia sp.]|nr:restriction endonuclease subunit S [Arachnia sp.]
MTSYPWPVLPLNKLAEVRLGRQRSPKNHSGPQMRPYLRAANVGWNGLILDDVKEMNFTDDEMSTYALRPGDLLLGEASGSPGEVGKPALWKGELAECAFQNTLLRVRSETMEPEFLLHFFRHQALSGRFVEESRGVGIHHLGRERLAKWLTPQPPLGEQRRIVAILEEHLSDLDDGVRTLANSVARVELLEGAVLDHGFRALESSPSLAIANLIRPGRRMAYGVLVPGEDIDSGIPMIRVGDLQFGSVGRSLKRISPDIERRFPRSRVEPGDLLLSVVGTIGRVAVVPEWARGFNVARAVSVIPLNDQIDPEFARLALQRPSEQRKLVAAAHEVARKTLNLEDLRRFTIPAPPLARQEQIAAALLGRLSACERTRGAIAHQARKEVGLRRAVLGAAFSGRLTGRRSDTDVIETLAQEGSA